MKKEEIVSCGPDVMNSALVFAGTRVPVEILVQHRRFDGQGTCSAHRESMNLRGPGLIRGRYPSGGRGRTSAQRVIRCTSSDIETNEPEGIPMAHKGRTQLLITFVATPDKVAEVDRLVASHGAWMAETHHREGPKALLTYNFAKGPELSNPLDPTSEPTGNTRYVLNEIYESPAGIADHWQQAQQSWTDFMPMVEVISGCNPQTLHGGPIAESLW